MLPRQRQQFPGVRSIRHGLREIRQLVSRKPSKKPVASRTAFGKGDDLDLLPGRLLNELTNLGEIRWLVARRMLKLHGSDANISHHDFLRMRYESNCQSAG